MKERNQNTLKDIVLFIYNLLLQTCQYGHLSNKKELFYAEIDVSARIENIFDTLIFLSLKVFKILFSEF